MRRLIVLALLALFGVATPAWSASLLARMEASLTRDGADKTIERYFDCENGKGYAVIETGDPRAVAFAVKMLKWSDACVTESLLSSLGTAMQVAPRIVLPYVGTSDLLNADQICLPFISEDEPDSVAHAIVARSRRAIEGVHDPKLEKQRFACLVAISGG